MWRGKKGGKGMAKQVGQILNPTLAVFVTMSIKFKRETKINRKKK
jgi:hypothetical protein